MQIKVSKNFHLGQVFDLRSVHTHRSEADQMFPIGQYFLFRARADLLQMSLDQYLFMAGSFNINQMSMAELMCKVKNIAMYVMGKDQCDIADEFVCAEGIRKCLFYFGIPDDDANMRMIVDPATNEGRIRDLVRVIVLNYTATATATAELMWMFEKKIAMIENQMSMVEKPADATVEEIGENKPNWVVDCIDTEITKQLDPDANKDHRITIDDFEEPKGKKPEIAGQGLVSKWLNKVKVMIWKKDGAEQLPITKADSGKGSELPSGVAHSRLEDILLGGTFAVGAAFLTNNPNGGASSSAGPPTFVRYLTMGATAAAFTFLLISRFLPRSWEGAGITSRTGIFTAALAFYLMILMSFLAK